MSTVVRRKHEHVADQLSREIHSGRAGRGTRLPGEIALAKRFGVSRATMRAALSLLADQGLIATRTGKGSFVVFDGRPLDEKLGWAHAFAAQGTAMAVRVLRIALERDAALARSLELPSPRVLVVERSRALADGTAVSYERSTVPALGALLDVPERGLVDDSLTRTLSAAGLHAARGEQRVRGRPLTAGEATVLGRDAGELFLSVTRTAWGAAGEFVEHVESLLDPAHFEVHVRFSDRADALGLAG